MSSFSTSLCLIFFAKRPMSQSRYRNRDESHLLYQTSLEVTTRPVTVSELKEKGQSNTCNFERVKGRRGIYVHQKEQSVYGGCVCTCMCDCVYVCVQVQNSPCRDTTFKIVLLGLVYPILFSFVFATHVSQRLNNWRIQVNEVTETRFHLPYTSTSIEEGS